MSRDPPSPAPELKVWNVKDFPVALRQRITNAAAQANVSVAEWVAAFFGRHWTEEGGDGQLIQVFPNGVSRPKKATTADAQELHDLARLAREVTPDGKDSAAMRTARSMVHERLKALRDANGGGPARTAPVPRTDRLAVTDNPVNLLAHEEQPEPPKAA